MTGFLIYLVETGICISLFYLGYVLFFRKETYFGFIRIYLVSSIVLSIAIPLTPININIAELNPIRKPIENIEKFKSYYQQLIYLTNAEYNPDDLMGDNSKHSGKHVLDRSIKSSHSSISITQKTILLIYFAGVLFFFFRFVYLIFWLHKFSGKKGKTKKQGITLIKLNEELPSFSFFNNVYINVDALSSSEFQQVFAHEKVHVKQKHSFDLLLAQTIILFQWFNPLAWRLQKSMKTVHEYIADQQVVEQGYKLFDYQTLLLSQLISIRSVELVNSFNLLSIKKRIAMMNKIKSGFYAKLKALITIPMVVVVFFLFVDMKTDKLSSTKNRIELGNYFLMTEIKRPVATQFREVNVNEMLVNISFDSKNIYINGKLVKFSEITQELETIREGRANENKKFKASLDIDQSALMSDVNKIFDALRNSEILKIAYLIEPADKSLSWKGEYAVFQVLPPLDAQLFDKDKLKEENIVLYSFTIEDRLQSVKLKKDIRKLILENEKYAMLFNYTESTSYGNYIEAVDAIYSVFYEVRSEASMREIGKKLDELTWKEKQPYVKQYPITLTKEIIK